MVIFKYVMSSIRETPSWSKYKHYLQSRYIEFSAGYCHNESTDHELSHEHLESVRDICNDITTALKQIDNLATEQCDVKDDECKAYCIQYCDHFSLNIGGKYWPYCPKRTSNRTEELLPINEDVDEYLNKFMANEDCGKP